MTKKNDFLVHMNPTLQNIWDKSQFHEPTAIQKEVIPIIMEGKDVVAQSPTGTGKTLAYLLPIIEQIEEGRGTQAVIVAPSRELVMQIYEQVQKWTEGMKVTKASLVGGANIKRQVDRLKKRPQIVVGTPGRLVELIRMKRLKMHEVKTIVLDEGDQLLSKEHQRTVDMIVKSALRDRQVLLFSATALEDRAQFETMTGRKAENISMKGTSTPSTVNHYYVVCEMRERSQLLRRIAKIKGIKALAFVRSVGNMTVVADRLQYEGVALELLHSDLRKHERENALKRLLEGEVSLLLATDVAARGLDIEGLTHVIHYDLAADVEQYVHRSGRTGRMGAEGTVVSFVNPRGERQLKQYAKELDIRLQRKRLYKGGFADFTKKKR